MGRRKNENNKTTRKSLKMYSFAPFPARYNSFTAYAISIDMVQGCVCVFFFENSAKRNVTSYIFITVSFPTAQSIPSYLFVFIYILWGRERWGGESAKLEPSTQLAFLRVNCKQINDRLNGVCLHTPELFVRHADRKKPLALNRG